MQKGFILTLFLVAVVIILLLSVYWDGPVKIRDIFSRLEQPRICNVGLRAAENPKTGECRQFPTSCDIPDGWAVVESCP
ncbi:MAG: hypothetical protein UU26_C0009G0043 [Candidatus Daviesbacteria bacterium GW2011_GWC1_40_9]|nr:MAG: hypothetical protein UU26_C0009G0043 [Candidatus Daviesbacteria bacterium GW2011_GWC1_40_9]